MRRMIDRGALDSFSLRFEDSELEDRFQQEEGRAGLTGYRIISAATFLLWIVAAILIPLGTDISAALAALVGGVMALWGLANLLAAPWATTVASLLVFAVLPS